MASKNVLTVMLTVMKVKWWSILSSCSYTDLYYVPSRVIVLSLPFLSTRTFMLVSFLSNGQNSRLGVRSWKWHKGALHQSSVFCYGRCVQKSRLCCYYFGIHIFITYELCSDSPNRRNFSFIAQACYVVPYCPWWWLPSSVKLCYLSYQKNAHALDHAKQLVNK